jgi:hypothetical protein
MINLGEVVFRKDTYKFISSSDQLVLENVDALASGIYTLQIFHGDTISKFPASEELNRT